MRSARFAAVFSTLILAPVALADESAGLQILVDMQDTSQISNSFCVHDSKLYSEDAQICVSDNIRLVCASADAAAAGAADKADAAEPAAPADATAPASPAGATGESKRLKWTEVTEADAKTPSRCK